MHNTPQALEDRLIDFGAAVCASIRRIPQDLAGIHISRQLIRSSTSPAANYAEARGAESRRDFVHKIQISLKELRETSVWLRFVQKLYGEKSDVKQLWNECSQLIAIFVGSVNTARKATPKKRSRVAD